MKKRILSFLLAFVLICLMLPTTAFAADSHTHCICGKTHKNVGDHDAEVSTTFTAVTNQAELQNAGTNGTDGKDGVDGKDGTNGTNGVDGKDGANGEDGQTPYIGENGNWWIGDTDTGVKAAGDDGKDGAIIIATAVGGTALISNIALIAWALIKKKRLF